MEVEKLCDRIGIIHKGRLIICGTLEEIKALGQREQSLESIFLELTDK
jgi:ABC-2 type transport system ATP-binding protein